MNKEVKTIKILSYKDKTKYIELWQVNGTYVIHETFNDKKYSVKTDNLEKACQIYHLLREVDNVQSK